MGQEESSLISESIAPKTLSARSLAAIADYIKTGRAKRIVVLTGAGISTAAGIPDFRSPKTGLYHNLARLNLPHAEDVFDISFFRERPEPFYVLAKELYPGKFHPTVSHAFIALLAKKGLLQMLFTQNIDCLERAAGVPSEKIIEAHGSFATQRCIDCKTEYPDDKMKEHVLRGDVPHCEKAGCKGLVKPDIVFFGEALPKAFDHNTYQVAMADLVIVIGTSLTVYPFAGLPKLAQEGKPRLLFNMERVGDFGSRPDDVIEHGACDDSIRKLADALGWRDELERLWRKTVGDAEATRQLGSDKDGFTEAQDEVEQLATEVEAALDLNDKKDFEETAAPVTAATDAPKESEAPTQENTTAKPEQGKDQADKAESHVPTADASSGNSTSDSADNTPKSSVSQQDDKKDSAKSETSEAKPSANI